MEAFCDRFVLIASCLTRSLLIIPRLFICAEIAHVPEALCSNVSSLSLSLLHTHTHTLLWSGSKLVSKVDFSRGLIATLSLSLFFRSAKIDRERRRRTTARHSTVYGSRLNRSQRKKGDRDKTKGLGWNLYRARWSTGGPNEGKHTDTRPRQREERKRKGRAENQGRPRGKKTLTARLFETWMAAAGRTNRQPLKT